MYNGFTPVNSNRRGRERGKIIPVSLEQERDSSLSINLNRKLNAILGNPERERFAKELLANVYYVLKKLNKGTVDLILCYGLGKFSESFCSLHQLAILVELKRNLKSPLVIYDPVFDDGEVKFLRDLNFDVLEDNEEGKRAIPKDKVTLVFLPHCPNQLVNNFLWANWNSNLRNCVIISNSFSEIISSNTKQRLRYSAKYILKCSSFCDEIPVKDTYNFPNVFNDLSIHFFLKLDITSKYFQSPPKEPVYSEDIEFVTKNNQEQYE